jgi:hypothetical protein
MDIATVNFSRRKNIRNELESPEPPLLNSGALFDDTGDDFERVNAI